MLAAKRMQQCVFDQHSAVASASFKAPSVLKIKAGSKMNKPSLMCPITKENKHILSGRCWLTPCVLSLCRL